MKVKKIVIGTLLVVILLVLSVGAYFYLNRQRFTQATPFGYDALGCKCRGLEMGDYCYGKVHDCMPAESMPEDY